MTGKKAQFENEAKARNRWYKVTAFRVGGAESRKAAGLSQRRIARELSINRETVSRYLRQTDSKPAISTPGSEVGQNPKPAISTLGSAPGRQSLCEPSAPQIEAAVTAGLRAQRIYQDFVSEVGFTGSY